jgi:cyclase
MFRPRVIPVLLLKNRALVKSVTFRRHRYIGDPINAVRIFNDLRADELVFLDTDASRNATLISLDFVRAVGEEASMPFSVGGGIRSLENIQAVLAAGAEKVVINTHAGENPDFVRLAADRFGSSTIVVCMDVKKRLFKGERTWTKGGTRPTDYDPVGFARLMERCGAGELIVQSIERDGTMSGYDLELIRSVADAVSVPVIALGGAGSKEDLLGAFRRGRANGLAAGSMFVYQDSKRGVLINYPEKGELTFD